MQSSELERIREKYQDLFDALEEYDRTRQLVLRRRGEPPKAVEL